VSADWFRLDAMRWLAEHPTRDDWYEVLLRRVYTRGRTWRWVVA
jgi:hypothetical protein